MPISNDNQDYKDEPVQQQKDKKAGEGTGKNSPVPTPEFDSDDLKGKKIDADLERPEDRPAEQSGK